MGAALAQVTPLVAERRDRLERRSRLERRDGLAALLADGAVRSGRDISPGSGVLSDADLLPVLPALRELLPFGALQRGSVVAAGDWSMLCMALAAGPVASGAWCAAAGIAEFGVVAAADAGLDPARLLLVPDLGPNWPQVVASLLDGCDLVLLRPPVRSPDRPSAQVRRRLEAAVRRYGAVLLVVGDWEGAQVRLRVTSQAWTGIGMGHGRLRGRRVRVVADGRGEWSRAQARWLWLPGPDGTVTQANDPAMREEPETTCPEIGFTEIELSGFGFSESGLSDLELSESGLSGVRFSDIRFSETGLSVG
jgi:membrane protein implicated in regulation of membrane protease activity